MCVFLVTRPSRGTIIFDLVTLTLNFVLLLKNFNLGHNFQTRRDRAVILHMCIPFDKTFHMHGTIIVDLNLAYFSCALIDGCYLNLVAIRQALLSSDNCCYI